MTSPSETDDAITIAMLRDEISRLQDEIDGLHIQLDRVLKDNREDRAENEQLRRDVENDLLRRKAETIDKRAGK